MQKTIFSLWLAAVALLCGCDKQTKLNTAKIDALSEKVVLIQQAQAQQLKEIQGQLTALGPAMDKINGTYFEKNHEDAFFFHTNTLYLLLLVERKIEAELLTAATERHAEHDLAYAYHTNQLAAASLAATQITEALIGLEGRTQTNISTQTKQIVAAFADELVEQIKAAAPDAETIARQKQLAADVAQLKNDFARLKVQLGITNQPAAPR
jgi:hypothetical protein